MQESRINNVVSTNAIVHETGKQMHGSLLQEPLTMLLVLLIALLHIIK